MSYMFNILQFGSRCQVWSLSNTKRQFMYFYDVIHSARENSSIHQRAVFLAQQQKPECA